MPGKNGTSRGSCAQPVAQPCETEAAHQQQKHAGSGNNACFKMSHLRHEDVLPCLQTWGTQPRQMTPQIE